MRGVAPLPASLSMMYSRPMVTLAPGRACNARTIAATCASQSSAPAVDGSSIAAASRQHATVRQRGSRCVNSAAHGPRQPAAHGARCVAGRPDSDSSSSSTSSVTTQRSVRGHWSGDSTLTPSRGTIADGALLPLPRSWLKREER
eukprot:363221-Chlamydomonas_euryale.AAC.36